MGAVEQAAAGAGLVHTGHPTGEVPVAAFWNMRWIAVNTAGPGRLQQPPPYTAWISERPECRGLLAGRPEQGLHNAMVDTTMGLLRSRAVTAREILAARHFAVGTPSAASPWAIQHP